MISIYFKVGKMTTILSLAGTVLNLEVKDENMIVTEAHSKYRIGARKLLLTTK